MLHFREIDSFLKYEREDYSAQFHEKFTIRKSIIFVKFKK